MRRLTQHVLAVTGISVLTAGAAVGSLTSSSLTTDSVLAAPIVSSAPVLTGASTPEGLDRRSAAVSRDAQRVELAASVTAERQRALAKQRAAQAKEQAALKKQRAAAQKRAEQAKQARQRAERAAQQKAAQKKAAQKKAAAAKAKRASYSGSPKDIARAIMQSKYGWGGSQFRCYNNIIMRESAWKVHADNPTSSAYGIPQALPGRKMASAGPDWRHNPATQIKWGLGYVKSRYGTPCAAWSFKRSHGWY